MTPLKVLVVEDDEDMRLLPGLILSRASFEVVGEVSNGAEGVAAVDALRPHVVVMDLEMPVMDGVEATRRTKAAVDRSRCPQRACQTALQAEIDNKAPGSDRTTRVMTSWHHLYGWS